jgi:hypothetical protein
MANALYGKGRAAFLDKLIDWTNDTINVTLIDAANYALGGNINVHQYMNTNTVPLNARGGTETLGTKTSTLGVAGAANVTFAAVAGTVTYEALIIWMDGGGGGVTAAGTTDLLIAYIDSGTGFPVTSNGGDITVTWDTGANLIFKL